jgi:hypothetical protein
MIWVFVEPTLRPQSKESGAVVRAGGFAPRTRVLFSHGRPWHVKMKCLARYLSVECHVDPSTNATTYSNRALVSVGKGPLTI